MKKFFTLLFFLAFLSPANQAQVIPNYVPYQTMTPDQLKNYRHKIWDTLPAAIGWINDFEDLFTESQEHLLEKTLAHFERTTSVEIAVVTVDSNMVAKNQFDEFGYRILKIWGIGKISKSNGILICICKDYKKICVITDFGIDKYVSEPEKNKMISRDFLPYFARNDYFDGTSNGLNALLNRIAKRWNKEKTEELSYLK